ncbi:ComEC/Rec2 family competence protein [Flaviaesturariibacter aridisoli]|nr:ComEC/Rec2 family competence protein [Flaviaesturariibacter aridisoli]
MPAWKHRPALRLLLPFAAGILLQWYAALPLPALLSVAGLCLLIPLLYRFLPLRHQFRAGPWAGLALNGLLLAAGAAACRQADIRQDPRWLGHTGAGDAFIAELVSEPAEKAASWKVTAEIRMRRQEGQWTPVKGTALLYFRKGTTPPPFGSRVQVALPLQVIRNSGNPGAFDYQRWCLFQGITHQAFVSDYALLPGRDHHPLQAALIAGRKAVTGILRQHLPGKEIQGLAEALLIGYKDDLDPELTAAYARTGVVHIIAISGMHLALVYLLLLGLTKPLGAPRWRILRLVLVLGGLWGFSLLAGGGPSVLRSAVMFSLLAIGGLIGRKGDSINSLLLAALLLLLINPFWLWDIGFQLSFTAVGGIVLFYRPIYQLYTTHNKALDFVWKGAAVSLAAQVLTTPLSLYHFHQFPLLFLAANLLAVPLSGLLVYALIAVCALSFWPAVAGLAGSASALGIRLLNAWIDRIDRVPFGVWDGLSLSVLQTVLLYGLLAAVAWALLRRRPQAWRYALGCGLCFLTLRAYSFYEAGQRTRLIVYQVPHYAALEVQEARRCWYRGDAAPQQDARLYGLHLKPAHTEARSGTGARPLPAAFRFAGKTVAQIGLPDSNGLPDIPIDLLVVSHQVRADAVALRDIRAVVLDASLTRRSAQQWKEACAEAGIPCHDVGQEGAFVLYR